MLEEIEKQLTNKKTKCVVQEWLETLDGSDEYMREDYSNDTDDFARAIRMINNPDNSSNALHKAFNSVGATFGLTAFKTHRREECLCSKA